MKRPIFAAVAAFLAAAAACSSDSTGANASIVGTYNLRTVGGKPLPFSYPGASTRITGGTFVVASDSTFVTTLNDSTPRADGSAHLFVERDGGRFTRTGSSLVITYDSDGEQQAVDIAGAVLSLHTDAGHTAAGDWVYHR